MPNKLAAIRHIRADNRKHDRNVSMRSATSTALKKAYSALESGSPEAAKLVQAAVSQLDKAAHKRAISRGRANRKKSLLMKSLNEVGQTDAA